MRLDRSAILTSLLLALTGAAASGCVAYDPYYPSYGSAVVVPSPPVYAAPPPVAVYPRYYPGYQRPYYHRPGPWGGGPWRGYGRGYGRGPGGHHGWR